MLAPWLQATVTIRRRSSNPARNSLNEPNYGLDTSYPIIYNSLIVRLEFEKIQMRFNDPGERVEPDPLWMYVEPLMPDGTATLINPEDRAVVVTSDNASLIGQLFIVLVVVPEWDAVGNVHHYVCQLNVH